MDNILGDAVIERTDILNVFTDAIKLKYNASILSERVQEAAQTLDINLTTKSGEEVLAITIDCEADTNMRNIGYILGLNDIEINYIYLNYINGYYALPESELSDLIIKIYRMSDEEFQSWIDKKNKNDQILEDFINTEE